MSPQWYWSQCNSFDDHPDLSFTAGGGIRQLPFSFLPGKRTEVLGLVGIHYNGRFYELVPWTGDSEWAVWPWGRWEFRGKCTDRRADKQFEVEIVAVTEEGVDGVPLRAPTKDRGMVSSGCLPIDCSTLLSSVRLTYRSNTIAKTLALAMSLYLCGALIGMILLKCIAVHTNPLSTKQLVNSAPLK